MNIRTLLLIALLVLPGVLFVGTAMAADVPQGIGDRKFVPITPIPGFKGGQATDGTLADYINAVFKLSLAAGAALAAIYIAIGGFEYIFSEAIESKKDGRLRIIHALYGLAILLLVTIILYIIGGAKAINLDIFPT